MNEKDSLSLLAGKDISQPEVQAPDDDGDSTLQANVDYKIEEKFDYPDGNRVMARVLTEVGKQKLQGLREKAFGGGREFHVPLQTDQNFQKEPTLKAGDVIHMDGLLAASLIRKLRGGYVCSFMPDFERLKKESARAVVQRVDEGNVVLQFDGWPSEFLKYKFLTDAPGRRPQGSESLVKAPITLGPVVRGVEIDTLITNASQEPIVGWFKNLIQRNFLPKKP